MLKLRFFSYLVFVVCFIYNNNLLIANDKPEQPKIKIKVEETQEDVPFEFRKVLDLGGEGMTDVIQDKDGFLWFSSAVGLIKYDGYKQKKYEAGKNSLSSSYILAIFEDSDGLIWIGTRNGINVYDKSTEKFTQYKHNPKDANSLPNNNMIQQSSNKILEDRDGNIWIATLGGLSKFNKKTKTFTNYLHEKNNRNSLIDNMVHTIIWDIKNKDYLWIGTANGLDRLNIRTNTFTHYKHNISDKNSISDNKIMDIVPEPNGNLWIATGKGVDKYDSKTNSFKFIKEIPNKEPWSLTKDGEYLIVAFNITNPLVRYNTKTEEITVYKSDSENKKSLSTNPIKNVFIDDKGSYWIVSAIGIVDKFDPKEKKFNLYNKGKNSLSENISFPRIEDSDGDIWIATSLNGPTIYNRKNNVFNHFPGNPKKNPKSLPNNYPSGIYEDSNGDIWIGTWGGLLNTIKKLMK